MDIKDQPQEGRPAVAGPEIKPDQEEAAKPPVRWGFAKAQPATFVLEIDLDRINPAWARGALLNADDLIKGWYTERNKAAKSREIVKPTAAAQFLREIKDRALGRKN